MIHDRASSHRLLRPILFLSLLLLLAAAPADQAGDWRDYRVVDLEERDPDSLVLSPEIQGVTGFRSRYGFEERDGARVYVMDKQDRTRNGAEVHWKFILDPETHFLIRMEKRIVGKGDKVVAESWRQYRDTAWDYPERLCHIFTIPAAIMAMKPAVGVQRDIYILLTEEASPWHMFLEVRAQEPVTVPGGTIDCFKVSLTPDYDQIMGRWSWASPIISPFVPDYTFWVEAAPPHNLVRFEGRFGPVGASPLQAYEYVGEEK